MGHANLQAGVSQIVPLAVVAVLLATGYVAIDIYGASQKDMLAVETRGLQMVSALGAYKRESGVYPDALDKLVPKHAAAVSKCPDGMPMGYVLAANEYVLSCRNVVLKYKPYSYDSRSQSWSG
ncbi:MAG TPA: hypothetical protein VFV04_01370 [Burkholderiales bacterium]|nr:hypothetical protein [Burkholderiales bacterium]